MKARTFDLEDHHIAFLDEHHSSRISRSELVRRALDILISMPINQRDEKQEAVNAIASATRGIIDAY